MRKTIFLGYKYWNQIVIGNYVANDFRFNEEVKNSILKKESLCRCGNYGKKIIFQYKGKLYSFNYLTGYPCQC